MLFLIWKNDCFNDFQSPLFPLPLATVRFLSLASEYRCTKLDPVIPEEGTRSEEPVRG
jgi:hypothetical protein